MKKIVFATNNAHKLEEIRAILGQQFEVLSLNDIGCHDDIPEDFDTLEENSRQKAEYIYNKYGISCFADDTGLEVDVLNGEPGVHSARYAEGTDHNSEANMQKLLRKLGDNPNRSARFRTVITLIETNPQEVQDDTKGNHTYNLLPITYNLFEGIVEGRIAYEKSGAGGFGYDPIFIPDGYDKSFAELGNDVKNTISHRARAVQKLADYLCRK